MRQGPEAVAGALSHLLPPPRDGSRASRCPGPRPAMLPLSVPSKVLGAVMWRVRVRVWWWPSLSLTGSAGFLIHPCPGAERDQRGPGNTVGGCLSALVGATDPWEGETPGLTSPDCVQPERDTAVSRGWSWNPKARSPERPRAYLAWADLRPGKERRTPRACCAHP